MSKDRYPDIEPIPDTPENIARAITLGPPKEQWDFEKALRGKKAADPDEDDPSD